MFYSRQKYLRKKKLKSFTLAEFVKHTFIFLIVRRNNHASLLRNIRNVSYLVIGELRYFLFIFIVSAFIWVCFSSTDLICIVFFLLIVVPVVTDVSGTIPYQSTCDPAVNNGTCSTSIYCSCATLVGGGNVCTQQMNCQYAAVCDASNSCAKPDTTCVIDPRCPGQRLCYSTTIFSPTLCPPLAD